MEEKWRIPKYPKIEGKHYVVIDKKTDFQSTDIENKGGILTTYIKKQYGVKTPSLYARRKFYEETGNYWWEQWLSVRLCDNIETKQCPFCDWSTKDIHNKSGVFQQHLLKAHNITKEKYLELYPEEREYFKLVSSTLDLQMETDESKFVSCPICGRKMKRITSHHLRKHNITKKDFLRLYPTHKMYTSDHYQKLCKCVEKANLNKKKEEFIQKAKQVHNDIEFDYSEVEYVNNRTKVKIIDPEYGEFWQTPSNHLKGQKHPKRKSESISKSKRSKQEEVIERFKEVHKGEDLDYSKVEYINMHTKVCIICHELKPDGTEYGEFWQEPIVHLKGCTHPLLGMQKSHKSQTMTTEEFITKAKMIHSDKDYSYELVEYGKNNKDKVLINCHRTHSDGSEHGVFSATPDNFLQGKGCPICGNQLSRAEIEIYDLISTCIGKENVETHNRTLLNGNELDIFIPSLKLAFEYNGLRWHSEKYKDKYYHINKTKQCADKGITLIQIFEDEYLNNKEVVLDKIRTIIGCNDGIKIGARKTLIKEIDYKTSKLFLDKYHIQGSSTSTVYLGAYYENEIVAVMTFKKECEGEWDLNRFATKRGFICQGIGSKMFSYFIKNYNPIEVKSFLDRRWCRNMHCNLYTILGFVCDEITKPDYRYTKMQGERKHKFLFRKNILHKKYGLPLTMTESEMTESLGYYKIWDCGLIRYVWKRSND